MTVSQPPGPLISDPQVSLCVEYFSSKLAMRVRFPSPAPPHHHPRRWAFPLMGSATVTGRVIHLEIADRWDVCRPGCRARSYVSQLARVACCRALGGDDRARRAGDAAVPRVTSRVLVDHRSMHLYPMGRRLSVRGGRKYTELTKHGCSIYVDGFLADEPVLT